MRCKSKFLACFLVAGISFSVIAYQPTVSAYAKTNTAIEDDLSSSSSGGSSGNDMDDAFSNATISEEDQNVSNWLKGQRGMTSKQLEKASVAMSPITNLFGYLVGAILSLVFTGFFVITALDIAYIAIPPIRGLLYSGGNSGGYSGGYNGYNSGSNQGSAGKRQLVSDEAVQCTSLLNGSQNGGGYNSGQNEQQNSMKSVLGVYFKKRVFFIILLAICALVLTSSLLLGTGINIAQLVMKLITMLNNYIPV